MATKRTLSLGGILDKALTGGFVEKTISASKRFASLSDEEKKTLLNTGSNIQTTAPLKPEVLQKNIELKEGMQKAAAKKFFNFEKSPLSISAAPTELIEAQKSPEAAAAYEKEQARRRLQYVRQNEGYFPAVGEALKQYGQAKVEAMQPVLELADTAANKVEEQGRPILGAAVRGAKGLYQTSVGSTAEAARQLGEGNPLGAAFTYGMGKMMTTSPTGMAWTAVMEQKPVKEHVQPVLDAWNNELDTFFADQKNNPFSPIGSVLKESGKLLPFLLFDKVTKIPFKTSKTIALEDGKTFEVPTDRKWYADAKQQVFNDILQLANNPAKFFKEKQFGLSIKPVSEQSAPIPPEQPLTKKQFVEQEKNTLAGEMSGLESEIRGTAMREVIEPMLTAQAGKRFQLPDGTFTGMKSTFPDWVPKHLRSRVLFDKATSLITENKPTPTNAKKLAELRGLVEAKIEERVKAHELYPELTDMKSYMTGLEKGFIGSPSPKRQLAEQSSSIGLELSRWDRARIKLQDRFLPVQKLQEKLVKEGGKITDESNIYLQEELYYGKTTDALSRFEEEKVKPIVEEVINNSAGDSKAHQTLKDSIDRYLYLSHAPERNAKLGDGAAGITTQEARVGLEQLKQTPQWPIIEKAGLKVRQLANDLPRFLVENDLIDEKTYEALKGAYENYVPLQRILPEGENIAQTLGVGKGFDVRGKDIKRAMGSDKPVQDIFESIIINWQRAIVRAEKNKVGLSVVKLILDNPKLKEVFEVIPGKPKAFEVGGQEIFYREAPKLPNVMVVKKGGKDIFIKINDADVASALKNLGTQNANILMKYIAPATRLYSSMNTSFNPEFIFTNPVKDIQQAALNISSELGGRAGVKLAPEVAKAVKGVGDYLRGRKNTEWGKLYDELKEQGGTTGFFQIKDRVEVGRTLKEMENEFSRSALGMPIRSAKKVLHGIEALNEMMENGTRLAAYKIALDSGKSKPQAASIAKNITVNFNRKGEWGSTINSLYAFANASIQGSFRTFKALKNPKTALKLITTIAAPSLAVNAWNDAIDEETHKKIPEYERQTNFIIMIGGGDYIKIPVPWGWNVFKVMADQSYDLATGKKQTPSNALIKSIAAFANAYNPLNGDSVLSSITPTLLRPLFDIKANTSWTGSPIAPQNYQKLKDSLNYYDSTNPMFIHIAEKLSELTGGKGAKPGAVEISPEALEYLYDQYGGGVLKTLKNFKVSAGRVIAGEDLVPKEIPIARRFFGRVNDEQFNKTSIYDTLGKAQEEILSPEDRKLLRNSLSLEIEAGRTTKEEAQKKMKDFDRYQIDLQQVEKAAKYIQERKLEGEKLEKFLRALQDEKFMKDREGGVFNQTQLKILRSKL